MSVEDEITEFKNEFIFGEAGELFSENADFPERLCNKITFLEKH